jgi:hypothetical protein
MYYKFDRIVINDFLTASRGKLPSYLIDPIFKAYETKTRLKRSGKGKSNEYKIAKAERKENPLAYALYQVWRVADEKGGAE